MSGTWAWGRDGQVHIPDTRIITLAAGDRYEALRGYGHMLAVWRDGKCVGYIMVEALGYTTAHAWLTDNR